MRRMTIWALLIAMGGASSSALAEDSRSLELTGFDAISIAGVYELDVEVGGEFAIVITGEAEALDRVEASVRDNQLRLAQAERKKRLWGKRNGSVHARVSLPSLTGVDVSGVVDGRINGVSAEGFSIAISGVGDLTVTGECGALSATLSGVGDLDAKSLQCREVAINVSGVGSASVFASEAVDAVVSGMGDIDVHGGPEQVQTSDSLFADITIHD